MNKRIKLTWIVSITSMICIVIFQSFWLYNIYQQKKREFQKEINEVFFATIEKEIETFLFKEWQNFKHNAFSIDRTNKKVHLMKKGEFHTLTYEKGDKNYAYILRNAYYEFIKDTTALDLDKIAIGCKNAFELKDIHDAFTLELIDFDSGKVLSSIGKDKHDNSFIATDIFHLGLKCNHGIVAYFDLPYRAFFQRMTEVLLASLFLFVVLGFCLVYQIKTILYQRRISEMREDFVYNMVHELKGPLAYIRNAVSRFNDFSTERLLPDQLNVINGIRTRSELLGNFLEKLLTEGKQGQHIIMSRDRVNIKRMLNEIVEQYATSFWKNADICLEYEPDVEVVLVDRVHFPNMIKNLVENAIKYSDDHPVLTIRCVEVNGYLEISVKDKGAGISKAYIDKVFESYYRVPNQKHKSIMGFGIGLSYVKRIAEAHGGSVSVKSELGVGSVFTVKIPVWKVPEE